MLYRIAPIRNDAMQVGVLSVTQFCVEPRPHIGGQSVVPDLLSFVVVRDDAMVLCVST